MNYPLTKHECTTPHPFQMLRWILVFSILFALIGAERSCAQNESGRRTINKQGFGRLWYDSTKHKYWLRVPIIPSLPPLTTDMPNDVLKAYIYLDSLAHYNEESDLVQFPTAWVERPELLKKTLAHYYTAMDYDPLRYQQYEMEVSLKGRNYNSNIGMLTQQLPGALHKSLSDKSERNALMSVLLPDYVLRVKVVAVDSIPTNAPFPNMSEYICNATVQVLDTVKGRRFEPCPCPAVHNGASFAATSSAPCLQLQYFPNNYFPGIGRARGPGNIFDEDSAFITSQKKFTMPVGQEAVVFLTFIDQRFDSTHDAFLLNPEPEASYNALPIIDGQIRDINHVWSSETMISYADWKQRFYTIREKILTGTY